MKEPRMRRCRDGAIAADKDWRRWYVTCPAHTYPYRGMRVWSVSRKKNRVLPSYGLTWYEAKELADAANAAWWDKQRMR